MPNRVLLKIRETLSSLAERRGRHCRLTHAARASGLPRGSDYIKAGFLRWNKGRNTVSKKWVCAWVIGNRSALSPVFFPPFPFFYNQLVGVADFSFELCLEASPWQRRPCTGRKWDRSSGKGKEGRKRKSDWIGEWGSGSRVIVWQRAGWLLSISKHLASIRTREAAGERGDRGLVSFYGGAHITAEELTSPCGGWRREQPAIYWNEIQSTSMTWK